MYPFKCCCFGVGLGRVLYHCSVEVLESAALYAVLQAETGTRLSAQRFKANNCSYEYQCNFSSTVKTVSLLSLIGEELPRARRLRFAFLHMARAPNPHRFSI